MGFFTTQRDCASELLADPASLLFHSGRCPAHRFLGRAAQLSLPYPLDVTRGVRVLVQSDITAITFPAAAHLLVNFPVGNPPFSRDHAEHFGASEIPAPHFHPHIFLLGITLTEKVMPPPERKNQPIHLCGSGLFLLMSLNPPAGNLPPAPFCQKETPWVNLVHSTGNPVQIGGLKHGANPHQSGRFLPVFLKLWRRVSMPKACRNRVSSRHGITFPEHKKGSLQAAPDGRYCPCPEYFQR